MGARFAFLVSLRASHPVMQASDIVECVGLPLKAGWTKGDVRTTPKGRVLDGNREQSYCTFDVGRGSDGELVVCLARTLDMMFQRSSELSRFRYGGGALSFFISWHPDAGDSGETFDPLLLGKMADLGIALELNVIC